MNSISIESYYKEILDSIPLTQDPDINRILEGMAMCEARLRREMDHRENTLRDSLINLLFFRLTSQPPYLITVKMTDGEEFIPKDTELFNENNNFLLLEDVKLTRNRIKSMSIVGYETIKSILPQYVAGIMLDVELFDHNFDLYLDAETHVAEIILGNIWKAGGRIIDYATGEVIGTLDVKRVNNGFVTTEIIGDPFREVYDIIYNKYEYHFIHLSVSKLTNGPVFIPTTSKVSVAFSLHTNCASAVNLIKRKMEPVKIKQSQKSFEITCNTVSPKYKIFAVTSLVALDSNEVINLQNGQDFVLARNPDRIILTENRELEGKILSADILYSNQAEWESDSLYCESSSLMVTIVSKYKFNCTLNSSVAILKLYQANFFHQMRSENKLLEFVNQFMSLFNLTVPFLSIANKTEVDCIPDTFTLCNVNLIQIMINTTVVNSLMFALAWARTFVRLGRIDMETRVSIVDENLVLIKNIYE